MILILIKNRTHETIVQTPKVVNYLDKIFYITSHSKKELTINKIDYNEIDLRCDDGNILKKIK